MWERNRLGQTFDRAAKIGGAFTTSIIMSVECIMYRLEHVLCADFSMAYVQILA